jgi:hypothetical protein
MAALGDVVAGDGGVAESDMGSGGSRNGLRPGLTNSSHRVTICFI